jgi:serine/threonine protein kinase
VGVTSTPQGLEISTNHALVDSNTTNVRHIPFYVNLTLTSRSEVSNTGYIAVMLTLPSRRAKYHHKSDPSPSHRQARRDAPEQAPIMSHWWTDEKINATINRQFIYSHLRRDEQGKLDGQIGFGDGLTDDTYLDWILSRARRLFLILVDIGVPDQIFYIVDESYDDDDLPIAAGAVRNLRLTYENDATLEKRFFKTQFQYLIRSVKEGEHIRYGDEESVPIEVVGYKAGIPGIAKDGLDKVLLPSSVIKVYSRKRVVLNEDPDYLVEDDVLAEVNSMKELKHDHLVSLYGSYTFGGITNVLLLPSAEWTLKSFLTDPPQSFKSLEKHERREILIKWPHCLASALAFLHSKSLHHGGIRPSNIFVDSHYHIFFGYLDTYRLIKPDGKGKDVESYEYAAPERWVRAPVLQSTAQLRTTLHSGGRTARKVSGSSSSAPSSATSKSQRSSYSSEGSALSPTVAGPASLRKTPSIGSFDTFRPSTAAVSKEYTASLTSSSQASSATGRTRSKSLKKPMNYTPSIASSYSSGLTTRPANNLPQPVAVPSPQLHSAIISTWQSQQHDPYLSDVFAFGAITLEILTHLCKRKLSAFTWHRSCKNRTPGRGGAPADASYHANLKQVASWIKALKKIAFDKEDGVFRAANLMLDLCSQVMVKDPQNRPTSEFIAQGFSDALLFANTKHHCPRRDDSSQPYPPESRPNTAVRRSIDNPKAALRTNIPAKTEAQPPVPPLPLKLKALLGKQPQLPPPLEPPPPITDLNSNNNTSSGSLASSAFSFERSGFRWDDNDDDEGNSPPLEIVGLPRQDSITTIPEFDFPPPIRHSAIINAGKLNFELGGGDLSSGSRFARTRTSQSGINFNRNWPLPSADEVDEVDEVLASY